MVEFRYMKKADMLEGEVFEKYKIVAKNTVILTMKDGSEHVKYCDTHIVIKRPAHNTIVLSSGGFFTKTTKERIEEYAPIRIYQKLGVWYVGVKDNRYPAHPEEMPIFYDGMVIDYDGQIMSTIRYDDTKKKNKLRRKISKFVSLITKDNIPLPAPGDCFYCSLRTDDGTSLGDAFKDTDHLHSHLEEGYLTGSLLLSAMKEAGYREEQLYFFHEIHMFEYPRRALRKYLNRRLLNEEVSVHG